MTGEVAAPPPAARFRLRLLAACVLLVGLALAQSPGVLVADTKLDLAIAPGDFLLRAVHLWDAEGAFGQLQNQAYGYLWPMGPFFWLGSLLEVPDWAVQRLWVALVMCVALLGVAKLAKALGVRSDLAAIAAGFAYALSPRMLTTLGPISIEAWPSALAPWVLLPLVLGARAGSPRRAAALSASAVAMVGGVNAAAAFAVIPLGALWLLTRTRGPRRRMLMTWWPLFTLLGTLWWLVPLFVMGAYSPPFLDYIEAADNTTFPTTLFDALRGTSNWVPYVDTSWRAGNDLIRDFYLAVNSGVLLFVGLWGIARRSNPHRLFLSLAVVLGLFAVTMGHLGSVEGWAAPGLNALLDGPLAPLRNVHKFDPLVRLPLVLGLAWLLDDALERMHVSRTPEGLARFNLAVLVGTTLVAVAGAALPAVAGRLAPAGGFEQVPGYWAEAADFLAEQDDAGTALLLPGSSFGRYIWGFPRDEPMQSLAGSPWAVRNAVPLTPAGNIRMLDAVERRLVQGTPSAGLASYLRRAGVSHLLVRNDLTSGPDVPVPVLVHQALDGSPGLARVATFGPDVGGEAHLEGEVGRVLVNGGWQDTYPAIEIYAVGDGRSSPSVSSDVLPVVVGGPEDLLDLADLDLLGHEPTILAGDVEGTPDPDQPVILTDGLRKAERHFGRAHDGTSATLTADDPLRMGNPAPDYLPEGSAGWGTTAALDGAAAVTASSSMADANAFGTLQPGQLPFAAIDGLDSTAWVANRRSEPAWWQVDLLSSRTLDEVTVRAGADEREVVRISTAGATAEIELPPGEARTVELAGGVTEWLRIEDASGRDGHRMSLAEVEIDDLDVRRSLVLPTLPADWGNPDAIVLRRLIDGRNGCVEVDDAVRCVQGRDVAGEETQDLRRTVTLSSTATWAADLRVQPRPGAALNELLQRGQLAGVTASSTGNRDPRASALAAIDGDPGTTWTAQRVDVRPSLTLTWLGERRVTGLRLGVQIDTAARLPSELTLLWPGGDQRVDVGRNGIVRLEEPIVTERLTLQVREAEPATDLGLDFAVTQVPVGIGELRVGGVPFFPVTVPQDDRRLPCGSGPDLLVGGRTVRTSVTASSSDLYAGRTVPAVVCGGEEIQLDSGVNDVDVEASPLFTPTSLVLSDGELVAPEVLPVERAAAGPVERSLSVGGGSVVTERMNTNRGWEADQDGAALDPVVVDGWQQGWQLADPTATVEVRYGPDRGYQAGLLAGLAGLLALAALAGPVLGRGRAAGDTARPALGAATLPGPALAILTLGVGGLLAGWWGLAAAVVGLVLGVVSGRSRDDDLGWLTALPVLPAALAYALRPWGGGDAWAGTLSWPHYLVVVSCAAVLGSVAVSVTGRRRTVRSRIAGISTSR